MITKDKVVARFNEIYAKMAESKDVKNMVVFGDAAKYMFGELAKAHLDMAASWLAHLEPICWDNYLSEKEMQNISKRTVNQDGTTGFHWPYDVFVRVIQQQNLPVEVEGKYNSYALVTMANSIYSDYAKSIAMDMGATGPNAIAQERMALSCYRKAVEKLTDTDAPGDIRWYFRKKMYDNSAM